MPRTEFWTSMADLAGRVAAGFSNFIDREIALAKLEASEDLDALANASRLFAAAALLAIGVVALLLVAAVAALTAFYRWLGVGEHLATSLAALSVAVVFAGLAWWLYANASAIMRRISKRLDRALTLFAHDRAAPSAEPLRTVSTRSEDAD